VGTKSAGGPTPSWGHSAKVVAQKNMATRLRDEPCRKKEGGRRPATPRGGAGQMARGGAYSRTLGDEAESEIRLPDNREIKKRKV